MASTALSAETIGTLLWSVALAALIAGGAYLYAARALAPPQIGALRKSRGGQWLLGLNDTLLSEQKREGPAHLRGARVLGAAAVAVGLVLIWIALTGG